MKKCGVSAFTLCFKKHPTDMSAQNVYVAMMCCRLFCPNEEEEKAHHHGAGVVVVLEGGISFSDFHMSILFPTCERDTTAIYAHM